MASRTKKLKGGAPASTPPALDRAHAEEEIYARIEGLKRRYANRLAIDLRYEAMYGLKRDTNEKPGIETIVSARPFDAVNTGVDTLTTYEPLIALTPFSDSEDDKKATDEVVEWLRTALYLVQRRSKKPIIPALTHHSFVLGRHAIRAMLIDKPRPGQFPIRVQVRDPKFVYPEFDEDGELWAVVECYERKVSDIKKIFPNLVIEREAAGKRDHIPLDGESKVEWAEWWDEKYYAYFVAGKLEFIEEHNYGRIPYVVGYGRYAPSADESEEAISILKGMVDISEEYNIMLSAKATSIMQFVNGVLNFFSDRNEPYTPKLSPGSVNTLRTDEKLEWMAPPQGMPELDRFLQILADEMENTTFPAKLSDAAAASGYAFNQISRGQKQKINPIKQNLEWTLGDLLGLMLDIAGKSGETIAVTPPRKPGEPFNPAYLELELTPEVAKRFAKRQVFVTLPPDYLEDQQQAASLALQLSGGDDPLLDKETARQKYLRVKDPEQVRQRIAEQQYFRIMLPIWLQQYAMPRMGIQPPGQPGQGGPSQGPPGTPQQPFSVPDNGGQPVTNPQAMGVDPSQLPDNAAGIPNAGAQPPVEQAADNLMGGGVSPQEAMQRLQARPTPQASGRGR